MFTELRIPASRRPMTQSEALISAVAGTLFSLMILAALLDEFDVRKLSVLFVILFWIPMLVVHELGHALMAKALGWRVREIVIGFGRDLAQWRIGETLIKIKLAPVEGYVLPAPTRPESVRLKSALIYAAGPGAELLVLALMVAAFGWDGVFGNATDIFPVAIQSLAIVILLGAGFNLLPFSTGGGVSDGLGILSSPFLSESAIELRLMAIELRDIERSLRAGQPGAALRDLEQLQRRFPDNHLLKLVHTRALSADGQTDAARVAARSELDKPEIDDATRFAWLHIQARVELEAAEPDTLTMDLALQKALALAPNAPDLLSTKGASLVRRGRTVDGGNLLADAWRRNDGTADSAELLAWLTIAAHRYRDRDATLHFKEAFDHINKSVPLRRLLDQYLG